MATYDEVIEALRRADEAGNVEDARNLAEIAQSMRVQQFPTNELPVKELPQSNALDAEQSPFVLMGDQPPPSMFEYLLNRAKIGLTPSRLISGSALQQGTFAGAFPTQPELEEFTTEGVQSRLGLKPEMRPATTAQKYLGSFVEGAVDPLNLFGGAGLLSKGVNVVTGGMAGVGGEFGGEVGQQVAGVPGQITGGILFSLLSGGGTAKGGQMLFEKGKERFDIKDLDVADLANVEGISRAKDLVEKALEADPTLKSRLETIQKRVQFVTGDKGTLAVSGLDSIAFKTKLEDLAKNDVSFAGELTKLYSDLKDAIRKKSFELYPAPSAELPSGKTKIAEVETDYNNRINFIDKQLGKLTTEANIAGGTKPAEIGTAIQNLVIAKEKAARGALKPEYESVLGQASKQGAMLPAQDTQDLLNTAEQLFQGDPWAKQAPLLKLVREQSSKFKAMRRQAVPTSEGTTLPATTAPDLTMGMDITSLDSLKRRVAQDIRETRDPNRQDKLRLLQTRVDEALDNVQNSSGNIVIDFRGEKLPFGQAMSALDNDYYNKVGIPFKDAAAIEKISSSDYAEKISPLIASSPTALNQFLRVAGDEGVSLAEKSVMSKLYNQSLNKNGFIDPTKLDNLLSKTSTNGGFSDIVDQLPALKQRLSDVGMNAQYLASEKVAIDDAARDARTRLGQSFLADYDRNGVEAIVSKITGSGGIGYRNRLTSDLKKLSSDEQVNVKLAIKNGLVTRMLNSENPLEYLQNNKDAFVSIFGNRHYIRLNALADVSRLANKVDVDNLQIRPTAVKETSIIERATGGVSAQRLSGIAVNQIASVFNKGFRILSLIGQANIDQATKEAHRKLFLDEGGVDAILNASTKIISKKGKEVDLKSAIKPEDLSDFATALGMGTLRSGYIGASTAVSPSQVVEPVTEPYYQYSPE
jgi:hypothetical protein